MKITQYCSVCKQNLEMDVVPTGDGEDDGVIWLRCPQCQGFLPKITGEGLERPSASETRNEATESSETESARETTQDQEAAPEDSDRASSEESETADSVAASAESARLKSIEESEKTAEADEDQRTLAEYAERLAQTDPETAVPYRSGNTYEVGDLIHHIAWDDCGLVVAKEALPGRRSVLKVFFEDKGLVRLIEADPHSS